MDSSVGCVQQDEGKDSIQERSHLFDSEPIIQMKQNLTVHFSLIVKVKLCLELEGQKAAFEFSLFDLPSPKEVKQTYNTVDVFILLNFKDVFLLNLQG